METDKNETTLDKVHCNSANYSILANLNWTVTPSFNSTRKLL